MLEPGISRGFGSTFRMKEARHFFSNIRQFLWGDFLFDFDDRVSCLSQVNVIKDCCDSTHQSCFVQRMTGSLFGIFGFLKGGFGFVRLCS